MTVYNDKRQRKKSVINKCQTYERSLEKKKKIKN